jgi:hypothetical protein
MGICKCKKRTDLFCFVHKKAVCEGCIPLEHQICVIKTYVEWLTDSEYDAAVCGICKGKLEENNVVRLTCLDLFHPNCLNNYAGNLPSHTAKAGYSCPVCQKPIFPSGDTTLLSKKVNEYLKTAPWTKNLRELQDPNTQIESNNPFPIRNSEEPNDPQRVATARKQQNKDFTTIIVQDDEDEDKYQKRSITQLLYALGFLTPSKRSSGKPTRIRFDTKRMLITFALLLTLIGVFVLGMSLTAEPEATSTSEELNPKIRPN